MQNAKDYGWIDKILSNLPDDQVQVGMLKILDQSKPGQILVRDLTNQPNVGKKLGVDTLHKMLRNRQINIAKDGKVFITDFGKKSIAAK